MEARSKFSLLRKLLGAIGLSLRALDDVTGFLSDMGEGTRREIE